MDARRSDLAPDSQSSATCTSPAIPPADKPKCEPCATRITVKEICTRLHLSERTVYTLLESREIPCIRLGRTWLISRYAYEKWERTVGTNRLAQSEAE